MPSASASANGTVSTDVGACDCSQPPVNWSYSNKESYATNQMRRDFRVGGFNQWTSSTKELARSIPAALTSPHLSLEHHLQTAKELNIFDMAAEKSRFTCGLCDYPKEEVNPWRFGEDTICWQCREEDYAPLFKQALKFDAQYPVKWQNEPIDVAFVAPFLGEEFVRNYRLKDQRANTIGKNRRFCKLQQSDEIVKR